MQNEYFEAHVPEPIILLGEPLRPFSLGAAVLLHRFAPRLIEGEERPTTDDLSVGIYVCSRTYEEAEQGMRSGAVINWAKAFGKKLSRMCKAKKKQPDPDEELGLLVSYIAEGFKAPTVWREERADHRIKTGAPELALLKVAIMSELGHSETSALNRPLRLSYYEYFALQEYRGNLHIDGAADDARRRAVAECLKKHPELAK